ncbi:PLP-dependent aminotransferase family protein [Microlunatus speluncae]|uniref:aminotransferase-like domain-containing protein n=1 Tax=Microlunatus speluncae TaxID=2594267 RepID=UPI001375BC47|nr:PLP-dependent aminotransferase family protein [Microlunatus speluncae]
MKFTAEHLARMLLESGSRSGPLHRQLSEGIQELIELGELPPEALLPSERALADAMTVSRTTVVTAYRSLCSDGRLIRRQGSGTRVCPPHLRSGERETVSSPMLSGDHSGSAFLSPRLGTVDFSTAALPCLPLVSEVAAGLTRTDYLALGAEHHGYHPRGLPALRESVARWYARVGVPTTAEQILITSGAQQALELITHGCLAPGDGVVAEAPTYRGALEAFRLAHARIQTVPADDHGMVVERLEQLIAQRPPRLVYAQSTVQNPTGTVLADGRRHKLARLAERHPVIVVDDTALSGTLLEGSQPVPLAGLTDSERLLTIGSMSKLYWGGLRIGWIRGNAEVVGRLAQMKGITDLGTSLISQQIAVHLLERVEEAQAARRDQLRAGLDTLSALLGEFLPDWTWSLPRGGPSLWVRTPTSSITNLGHVALRYGVVIAPGTAFGYGGGIDDHTRLPYVLPAPVLRAGIQRLARAWESFTDGARVAPVPVASITT